MSPIPLRMAFRNKWFALMWAAGICYGAASFASGQKTDVDAANASDSNAAQISALAAEASD